MADPMSADVESAASFVARVLREEPRNHAFTIDQICARDALITARAVEQARAEAYERAEETCGKLARRARERESSLGIEQIHKRNAELAQALGASDCAEAIRKLAAERPK